METIIRKAIEGGYKDLLSFKSENQFWVVCNTKRTTFVDDENGEKYGDTKEVPVTFSERKEVIVLDPLFWQALGKACGWGKCYRNGDHRHSPVGCQYTDGWLDYAKEFHEINLTEGWDKAILYLNDLIK